MIKINFKVTDLFLILAVMGMCIFGIIIIGSATHVNTEGMNQTVRNQQIYFMIGTVAMLIVMCINYHFIAKFWILIFLLNIFLLVAVLIVGEETNGATRWLEIAGFSFQPSEFSKLFMIIFLAAFFDKIGEKLNHPLYLFGILVIIGFNTFLILIEPSMSASLIVLTLCISMLFIAGISYKYVVGFLLIAIPLVTIGLAVLLTDNAIRDFLLEKEIIYDYHIERLEAAIYDDEYYEGEDQQNKSMQAIGSGELTGKGLYEGTVNQLDYLPENQNDFIFAVVGEEFGFIGCISVLSVMLFIILRCFTVGYFATDLLGRMLACGSGILIAIQTFVNVGVATGILPNTGASFPFLSAGGSALIIDMICIGLVLSVSVNRSKKVKESEIYDNSLTGR